MELVYGSWYFQSKTSDLNYKDLTYGYFKYRLMNKMYSSILVLISISLINHFLDLESRYFQTQPINQTLVTKRLLSIIPVTLPRCYNLV